MSLFNQIIRFAGLMSCVFGSLVVSDLACAAEVRPPQFVMFSFDGSKSMPVWQETRAFAKTNPVKFTYFVSGTYMLTQAHKGLYHGPHHKVGASDIGFGGDSDEMMARVNEINSAYSEGNEIGSHANGHYDGSTWSESDWADELRQFSNLLFNTFTNNSLQASANFAAHFLFNLSEIAGFRAPLLGVSVGLWPALKQSGYSYDTSRTADPKVWPRKLDGLWSFPIACLRIAGTGKRTLSMDYNFYYAQSGAKPDPAHSALYEQQMYDTYMEYFRSNYNGNRAPVHLADHFSLWNGGAYWHAMQRVAKAVCGLPEVRCVNYSELVKFMESQPTQILAEYQQGRFPRAVAFNFESKSGPALDVVSQVAASGANVQATLSGRDAGQLIADLQNGSAQGLWKVGDQVIAEGTQVTAQDAARALRSAPEQGLSFVIHKDGQEILRTDGDLQIGLANSGQDENAIMSFQERQDPALIPDPVEAHEDGEL
jgi:hypothetical protein